ncbi:unnamed protein product [Effrenium voratum]|uniref:Uncharacterized protein n=1 Tax=Effrenium voratum TaxID=2562239 RepID=A0AA36JQP0_9DINO|nr:unnamed protein product [Effrenium voratum]
MMNGLFAIDADELRVLGAGTSMANWREVATNETQRALEYIRSELGSLGASVSIEHLRWAYLAGPRVDDPRGIQT